MFLNHNAFVTLNGTFVLENSAQNGGGVYVTSGANLQTAHSTFQKNSAQFGGAIDSQGGIFTTSSTYFSSNQASANGGAIYMGGVDLDGTAGFVGPGAQFLYNKADLGAGIFYGCCSLSVEIANFYRNQAASAGGGIVLDGGPSDFITIQQSTFEFNSAGGQGGGLFIFTIGAAMVENSTLVGNSSLTNAGGGVAILNTSAVTLRHDTITRNGGGGVDVAPTAALTLENSIVANNYTNLGAVIDVTGDYSTDGANLVDVHPGALLAGPAPLTGDPLLDELANFGTGDVAQLKPGSPAIDAAVLTITTPPIDQTGASRIFGPVPDLGAVESRLGSDPTLDWFTTTTGPLDPVFNPLVTSYKVTVASDVLWVLLNTSATDPASTVMIRTNGGAYTAVAYQSYSPTYLLNPGDNFVEILVTAANGLTSKTYTLTVNRGAPGAQNTALATLASDVALEPGFNEKLTAYHSVVTNDTTSIVVWPATADPAATLAVRANFGSFAPLASGAGSPPFDLNVGDNLVDIRVTAPDGITTTTITLTIRRVPAPADNADLAALSASASALTPAFSADEMFYHGSGSTPSTTVTASPADPAATMQVRVNGGTFSPLASGVASAPLSLAVGSNQVEVLVTAANGVTVRSYILVIEPNPVSMEGISTGSQAAPVVGNGASNQPAVSSDGRFVAFSSSASNLVANDTNNHADIFVYDRTQKVVERVSVDSNGAEGNNDSSHPSISSDGRYVAFQSQASNLVPSDTNGQANSAQGQDIFVYDRQAHTMERVSLTDGGGEADQASENPSISGDGNFVAFDSPASNLVSGFVHGPVNVYITNRGLHTIQGVTVPISDPAAIRSTLNPVFARDGSALVFELAVTRLAFTPPAYSYRDIYVFDLASRTLTRVSGTSAGLAANGSQSSSPSISDDGQKIAFQSNLKNLNFYDLNNALDVFVFDRSTGKTRLVSVDQTGQNLGSQDATSPAISGDGQHVAFQTHSDNLVTPPTDGGQHIFMKDLSSDAVHVLSLNASNTLADQPSELPALSADGLVVAFESLAANLNPGDNNAATDIFVSTRPAAAPDSLALLSSLIFSAGSLNQPFSPGVSSYTLNVANAVDFLTLRATPASRGAALDLYTPASGYFPLQANAISEPLPLNIGANSIHVRVTAADGVTMLSYTVVVFRTPSSNADLAGLSLQANMALALSPTFASAAGTYTVSAPNNISSVQVVPTAADGGATITVNGTAVNSGAASAAIALAVGPNPIQVVVQAQDGSTQRVYSLTVTRAAPDPNPNTPPLAYPLSLNLLSTASITPVLPAYDSDGDALTFSVVTPPLHGTLSGTAPNFTYTPAAGYAGSDSFTFKVNDGKVNSSPAQVSITIRANQAPIPANDSASVFVSTSTIIPVRINDYDPDGDALTVTAATGPSHGTAVEENGQIRYTPANGYLGPDSFTYTANDGVGGSVNATVTIAVQYHILYLPTIKR